MLFLTAIILNPIGYILISSKISIVYGFMGASLGDIPLKEVSRSITAYGRNMIEGSKKMVEENFTIKNGYKSDAIVVYGDTDSIMVFWGANHTIEESYKLGKQACVLINDKYPKPCNIELEKHYFPYLLISKKRYAGKKYEGNNVFMSTSGLETGRRDNCALLRRIMNETLRIMLWDNNPNGALEYVKTEQQKLLRGKIMIDELIITVELKNDPDTYKILNPVSHLAKRMKKRDPSNAPKPGERVAYVIVDRGKRAKTMEKSEDPLFAIQNKLPIDYAWYNEHQLAKPIYRLFRCFPGITEKFFINGNHTRISKSTNIHSSYFKPVNRCILCKKIENEYACCGCKDKDETKQLVDIEIEELGKLKVNRDEIWDYCLNCAGSRQAALNCTARDCPKFFVRYLHKENVKLQREKMDRMRISEKNIK